MQRCTLYRNIVRACGILYARLATCLDSKKCNTENRIFYTGTKMPKKNDRFPPSWAVLISVWVLIALFFFAPAYSWLGILAVGGSSSWYLTSIIRTRCPKCNKSAFVPVFQLGPWNITGRLSLFPEKKCSRCGFDL